MTVDKLNLIIAGVGGQGTIRAAQIVGAAAMSQGLKVLVGETYGAAQRGGSVRSQVRVGSEVFGPLIPYGRCDVVLGLEPLEAARCALEMLRFGGRVVSNSHPVPPVAVKTGDSEYPALDDIIETLRKIGVDAVFIDATRIAETLGNRVVANTVMLGAFSASGGLPFSQGSLRAAIAQVVSARHLDINLRAFEAGLKAANQAEDRQ